MERADAWGTRAREVAGDDALDGARCFGGGEQVRLEVEEARRDAADDDVDAGECLGQFLDAVGDVPDPDIDALGRQGLRRWLC